MSSAVTAPKPGRGRRPWLHRPDHGDRVRQPVRAQSKWADAQVLKGFSRRPCYREQHLATDVLHHFFVQSREAERERSGRPLHGGELQARDLPVVRYLIGLARCCDEVYPTVAEIAKACGVRESTVYVIKDRLRDTGTIDWMHRAVEIDGAEEGEPSVRQTSNLYRINELPERIQAAAPKPLRDAYRQSLALSRKQAAERVKAANAKAAETEKNRKLAPQSPLVRRLIGESLAASQAAAGAVPDSS